MKEELKKLYYNWHERFKKVKNTFPDVTLHGPFLMSPNTLFLDQKNPLLIIGQETYGWSKSAEDIEQNMFEYEDFNVGVYYYSSPFWNITRKVEQTLGNETYSCAWTNISKYDVNGGRATGIYENEVSTLDEILIEEIDILKPKICIFFTGPNFDHRIRGVFREIEFCKVDNWNERQLCQLKHPNLPEKTFRTYHPNYLRRSGLEQGFIDFLNKSINNQ